MLLSAVEPPHGEPIPHGYFCGSTEIRRLEERNQEIDDVFLNLYTDKSKGIISEQRFLKLTDAMEQEQNSNKARLSG